MRRSHLFNCACKRFAVALALGLAGACLAVPAFAEGSHTLLGTPPSLARH